jgi:hypothetical protein
LRGNQLRPKIQSRTSAFDRETNSALSVFAASLNAASASLTAAKASLILSRSGMTLPCLFKHAFQRDDRDAEQPTDPDGRDVPSPRGLI